MVDSVRLLCIHTAEVEVEHGTQGISLASSGLTTLGRCGIVGSAGHLNDGVAVLDPSVVQGPGILTAGIAGSHVGHIAVPDRIPVVAAVGYDVLTFHVTCEEERGVAVVVWKDIGGGTVDELTRKIVGKVAHEVVKRSRRIGSLVGRHHRALWGGFLDTAGQCEHTGCSEQET